MEKVHGSKNSGINPQCNAGTLSFWKFDFKPCLVVTIVGRFNNFEVVDFVRFKHDGFFQLRNCLIHHRKLWQTVLMSMRKMCCFFKNRQNYTVYIWWMWALLEIDSTMHYSTVTPQGFTSNWSWRLEGATSYTVCGGGGRGVNCVGNKTSLPFWMNFIQLL